MWFIVTGPAKMDQLGIYNFQLCYIITYDLKLFDGNFHPLNVI